MCPLQSGSTCFRPKNRESHNERQNASSNLNKIPMNIALLSSVFPEGSSELQECLHSVKSNGAELALLPECPAQPWVAATSNASPHDAERAARESPGKPQQLEPPKSLCLEDPLSRRSTAAASTPRSSGTNTGKNNFGTAKCTSPMNRGFEKPRAS